MLIKIHTTDVHFTLPIPNFILMNRYACQIIAKMVKESNCPFMIEAEQLQPFIHELVRLKKDYGRISLVEVDSAEGEHIQIIL